MKGKLLMIDDQSTVIDEWTWTTDCDEDADILLPLRKLGPSDLAGRINHALSTVNS